MFIVGAPEHWVPRAIRVSDVTELGKLTLPVVVPLVINTIALPAEAIVSVITLAPDGRDICSDSMVATSGAAAKER
jgi:hypothetical protein